MDRAPCGVPQLHRPIGVSDVDAPTRSSTSAGTIETTKTTEDRYSYLSKPTTETTKPDELVLLPARITSRGLG